MNWFRNLGITRKLAVAFTLTTAMTLALGAFALIRLSEANAQLLDISSNWMPAVQSLGEMRAQLGEYRTYEQAQLGKQGDAAAIADYDKRMADTYRRIVDAKKQYDAIDAASLPEKTALEQKIESGLKTYFGAHQRIAEAIAADDFDTARKVSGSDSRISRRDLFDALKQLSGLNAAQLDKNVATSKQAYRRTLTLFVIALSALIVVAAALGWIISRAIARPLTEATQAARAIAAGKLDGTHLDGGKDEIGDLLRSMQAMRDVLQRFAGESRRMARLHAEGEDISYRMPEDFPGIYNELVAGTNNMVFEHIDAIVDAIGVLNEYAAGDLRRDVPRLPGQRAILHESMDAAKASLVAMRDAILKLSEAAARGDFSVREDADKFEHSFREMVTALNRLMAEAGDGLGDIGRVVSAIATGDLRQRVEKQYPGAFGALAADANRTAEQLTGIVGGILHASDTITTAAGEIASGNSDLSRRTEQQAANLEETAASMEELTSTVKQNAESARQANQLAQGAASVARDGGDVVGQVVTTMHGIEASSKKIAEIISVIDGIAFQTNILALNAAVEAARAGEQGRGFAVVASEVRSLAQRSAEAAKEIKHLIDDSVGKVADGSALVSKAGSTMAEIVTSVQRVTDIMAEISAASQEQSAGIEQVNLTITQMDETTQQNAALVEEATAAARSMEEQAIELAEAVARFQLDNAPPAQPARLRSAA